MTKISDRFNQYQNEASRTSGTLTMDPVEAIGIAALGLCGESGEIFALNRIRD